jgi:hypothetical protein
MDTEVEVPPDYDPANPEVVYQYSASCPEYGCEINEVYYYNYRHIDYCDLEGEAEGESFSIKKYAKHPDPVDCEWTDVRTCTEHFVIPSGEDVFMDVDANNEFYDSIGYVKSEGIVEGYEDGSYMPDQTINRAEFTKIIVESVFGEPEACLVTMHFTDVGDEWYANYICKAVKEFIIVGYPDGSFKPADKINFAGA